MEQDQLSSDRSAAARAARAEGGRIWIAAAALALAAAGVVGWSMLWRHAADETDALLTAWIAQEARSGRTWTCPERRIAGYPMRIAILCPALSFEGTILDRRFAGSVGGFEAAASALRPDRIAIRIDSPFAATTPEGDRFTLGWRALDLRIEAAPDKRPALALSGETLRLMGITAEGVPLEAGTQSVSAALTPSPDRDNAYDFAAALKTLSIPAASERLALAEPLDAAFAGVVTDADLASAGGFAERAERWRLSGGRIDFATASLSSGTARAQAQGSLSLDEERRPQGRFDATLEGVDGTLRKLGVNPAVIAAGSLLTRFLAGAQGKTPGPQEPQTIKLPLRIDGGYVSIGPIRTGLRAPSLY